MNKNAKFIWYIYNGNQKAKNKHEVFFKGKQNLKQAAVAIIFWTPNTISGKLQKLGQAHTKSICNQNQLLDLLKQENFQCQLMICQRQFNLRDLHSNGICFPGGKLDKDENDFEAVIREVMEEVDVDLRKQETFYIGRLPNNIETSDAPKGLRVCAHVFIISGEQPKITLNQQELQDVKWIPLSYFYDLNDKIRIGKCSQSFTFFMVKSFFQRFPKMIDEIVKNFDHGLFGQIDVGMKSNLYGFSLLIFAQLCNLVLSEQQESRDYFGDIRLVNSIVNIMELYFMENTVIGKLCDWYFSKMYKTYRIEKRVEVKKYLGKL